MKNISMKKLIGKKIIWVNEDDADCVFFKTEDNKYFTIDVGRSHGACRTPQLHECSEAEASELVEDNPY